MPRRLSVVPKDLPLDAPSALAGLGLTPEERAVPQTQGVLAKGGPADATFRLRRLRFLGVDEALVASQRRGPPRSAVGAGS